jgi:hypothetical protein
VDGRVLADRARYTVDTMLAEIAALPEPEEMRAAFDEESQYAALAAELNRRQSQAGEMLWCPADWDIIPAALWYSRFGYENALMLRSCTRRRIASCCAPAPSAAGSTPSCAPAPSARAPTRRPSSPAKTCAVSAGR